MEATLDMPNATCDCDTTTGIDTATRPGTRKKVDLDAIQAAVRTILLAVGEDAARADSEWRGVLTLETLLKLKAFGRIDGISS